MTWPSIGFPELAKYGFSSRVVPPDGDGTNAILIVGEAPGYHEDSDGIPFHPQADAGSVLNRVMSRAGVPRRFKEDRNGTETPFKLTNCVWQRPPDNELADTSYEQIAVDLWRPHNQRLIDELKPKVIMLLGNTALKAFTPYGRGERDTIIHVQNYAIQGDGVIYLPGLHPSFLLHGQQAHNATLIWLIGRAITLAREGIRPQPTRYIEYPTLADMLNFERGFNPSWHTLSYDIETPESDKLTEEDVEDVTEDISYNIVRASACYDSDNGYAISFPWREPFIDVFKRMMATSGRKWNWNGNSFDNPRLRSAGVVINGRSLDLIDCWHFIQPTLPRSLEFATPLLGWKNSLWKPLSDSRPEYYSAVDAHATHFDGVAMEKALKAGGRWDIYEKHVVRTYEILTQMSKNGLPYDKEEAKKFEVELTTLKEERELQLQDRVPDELKSGKQSCGYKKVPKQIAAHLIVLPESRQFSEMAMEKDEASDNPEALIEVQVKYEFRKIRIVIEEKLQPNGKMKVVERKAKPLDTIDKVTEVERWVRIEDFLPTSSQQMIKLIKFNGHSPGTNRKTKNESSDDETLRKIIKKCLNSKKASDAEFLVTLKMCREVKQLSKVLGTYVKGWQPGLDGRIHSTPGFWGKMMRISWRRPNIAATIADKQEDYIASGFRKCVCAPPGKKLLECDWKGIEGVIVGWFAGDKDYMRLAKIGVHDYFAAHVLATKGKILHSDIPSLSLSDKELKPIFKSLKERFPKDRDDAKHIVHGQNYGMGPGLMSEMYEMPLAEAERLQIMYFNLFPKVKAWQDSVVALADRQAYLTNPFKYKMSFWEVRRLDTKYAEKLRVSWRKLEKGEKLMWFERDHVKRIEEELKRTKQPVAQVIENLSWKRGDDAKSAISFLPRDTAAAMLKECLNRVDYLAFDGRMLSSTHDSILTEVYDEHVNDMAKLLYGEMTKPVEQLDNLVVDVEVAVGQNWDKKAMGVYHIV